ncbi:MAG: hypothetical protein C4320_07990 [Armatimonadota bacterium]
MPLEGVRVADFTWVWAGPVCTMQLAHLGADVIRVESSARPDTVRGIPPFWQNQPGPNRSGYYNQYNQGKRSITLNIKHPKGLELAYELVRRSDVVTDNFSAGAMERMGLGYEQLRKIKPDIIQISMAGHGQTGPVARYVAYGPTQVPMIGLASLTGYGDDGVPIKTGISYGDPVAGKAAAAAVARRAVAGSECYVLGAIGPCGKPIEPVGSITREAAKANFLDVARALQEGGVDGFLLETFIDLCELELAVEAVREVSDKPVFAAKAYIEDGELLAEGFPARCTERMASWGVDALGANCVVGPQRMLDLVRSMGEETELPILALPTPGLPQIVKGHVAYDVSPDYFARASSRLVEEGARIVGGCCGTTPAHIAALRALLDAGVKAKPRRSVVARSVTGPRELPPTEPSELALKLGNKFVTAVEMDVPRGLDLEKLLHGARTLKIAGADVINISDGARARLRMDPASVAAGRD